MDLKTLKQSALEDIGRAQNLTELGNSRIKYLGRKGELAGILANLKGLSAGERKKLGIEINSLKQELTELVEEKVLSFKLQVTGKKEWIDVTAPGKKVFSGHLHPLTLIRQRIEEIFQSMGFSVVEGPEIETEHYNFDALNIPANHPARDLWDTFWLQSNQKSKIRNPKSEINSKFSAQGGQNSKLLLRTHTSPVQIHYMESHQPPLRIIAPGRCFRHEATDASHDFQFHQVEGLMVNHSNPAQSISIINFKGILEEFFSRFFARDIKIRLRPSYFPFVEPGFEVDISCPNHKTDKCGLCGGNGYLEIMGAGMVHPNVFKSAGYNPNDWQGFAFGLGLERLAMIKYGINDIRLFHSGDLRFLKQF